MTLPLGYLFWHRPKLGATDYEDALAAFHQALSIDPPAGFVTSWTWRLDLPPWFAGSPSWVSAPLPTTSQQEGSAHAPTYLDVYVTADLTSLGHLEQAAISGPRRIPHDRAAAGAAAGAGALMQAVAASEITCPAACLSFCDKPPGADRDRFVARLAGAGDVASVWMRRMVLGPGPEYLVVSAAPTAFEPVWSCRPAATITATVG